MLSQEMINELKIILQEEYGLEVAEADLTEIGTNLVSYFDLLAKVSHQ